MQVRHNSLIGADLLLPLPAIMAYLSYNVGRVQVRNSPLAGLLARQRRSAKTRVDALDIDDRFSKLVRMFKDANEFFRFPINFQDAGRRNANQDRSSLGNA